MKMKMYFLAEVLEIKELLPDFTYSKVGRKRGDSAAETRKNEIINLIIII